MREFSIKTADLPDLKTLLTFEQGVVEAERPVDSFLGTGKLHYYNTLELISSENIHFIVAVSAKELVASAYLSIENSRHYHKNIKHSYIGFTDVNP